MDAESLHNFRDHGRCKLTCSSCVDAQKDRVRALQVQDAREFAKQQNIQLTWCYARDTPMHPDDRELKTKSLDDKRVSWLQRHDQDTCNITSLLPLVVGMPVRLTDHVDRRRQL